MARPGSAPLQRKRLSGPAETNCSRHMLGGVLDLAARRAACAAAAQPMCELACAGIVANKSYIRLHKSNTEYQERSVGKNE